jgi:hypothetical protein
MLLLVAAAGPSFPPGQPPPASVTTVAEAALFIASPAQHFQSSNHIGRHRIGWAQLSAIIAAGRSAIPSPSSSRVIVAWQKPRSPASAIRPTATYGRLLKVGEENVSVEDHSLWRANLILSNNRYCTK